ncbi:multi antimicrobial extrusion protein MatE [Aquibacillus sp. 3ASR75-54]|uniref:Multi antimicrobial extrusion protein MatE n=1 Tax=Aquibacillus salsiterrae TaxID=2950439 RepID=A0A9X3WFX4_9BACI|nr:multi antimicrobial extrusion protein MatE [Aquibacillus salsiterrae]MDC3418273.1 multi antimicrobial extrusion protein MatE [Aquibacillus salsiterrae]
MKGRFSYKQLVAFFIPLGFSASLTAITHVIINGTMSRGENAAFIIACYAVSMSIFGIIEKPLIIFRQTCSALVKDKRSFKKLILFLVYVVAVVLLVCFILGFTSIGDWVFIHWFNAEANMVKTVSDTFKILTIVMVLSGIRGIYEGIIIKERQTKWLTIMVVVRLATMFVASYLFVVSGYITSLTGAMIFLIGMAVESVISVWKGQSLLNEKRPSNSKLKMKEIIRFYNPLLFYFISQTFLIPIIYVFLSKTNDKDMAIASFALAISITGMVLSFFSYTHQLVLQFYEKHRKKVVKFTIIISFLPSLLLILLCYSPIGMWFMEVVMGANEGLTSSTIHVLQLFIVKTLVFPWVDFMNGFFMLRRKTNKILIAQILNLSTVVISLLFLISFVPEWNGLNGSIASSLGEVVGLLVVMIVFFRMKKEPEDKLRKTVFSRV